jgi:uncharacterized phage-like protein YoqJ
MRREFLLDEKEVQSDGLLLLYQCKQKGHDKFLKYKKLGVGQGRERHLVHLGTIC